MGMTRIPAFHKPNSKTGITDKHFPNNFLLLSDFFIKIYVYFLDYLRPHKTSYVVGMPPKSTSKSVFRLQPPTAKPKKCIL